MIEKISSQEHVSNLLDFQAYLGFILCFNAFKAAYSLLRSY